MNFMNVNIVTHNVYQMINVEKEVGELCVKNADMT